MKREEEIPKKGLLILGFDFCIILLSLLFSMNVFANSVSDPVKFEGRWEYRLGDSPMNQEGIPSWTLENNTDGKWKTVTDFNVLGDKGQTPDVVWFKTTIPPGDWRNKCVYFEQVYGQSLTTYIDSKKVYEKNRKYLFDMNRFIVSLSADDGGKTIYLRTQSIYGKFGPRNKVLIGDYNELYTAYFFKDFSNIPLGLSLVFISMMMLPFPFLLKVEQKKSVTSLCFIILLMGILVSLYPTLIILFKNFDQYLTLSFSVGLLLLFIILIYFFQLIFGPGYRNMIGKALKFQIVYSALCVLIYIIDILSDYKIVKWELFFTINILGIIFVVQFIMLIGTTISYAVKGNTDARIFMIGFSTFAFIVGIELMLFIFYKDYTFFLWKWGILCFIISFGVILGRRAANNYNKVLAYSKELEMKNHELDGTWKEIKESRDQLADLNTNLEKRVAERTKQLEDANNELSMLNEELSASNNELCNTLEILKEAQDYLIKSEKMAALGQLVSGVAHEINTPLGAIQASITNIFESLKQVYENLPHLDELLKEGNREYFFELLNNSIKQTSYITSREEREYRRVLVKQLERFSVKDPEELAENLVVMGIYDIEPFQNIVQDTEYEFIIKMAYLLSSLRKNAQTISIAAEKTSKVVFALKTYAHQSDQGKMLLVDIRNNIETVLTLYYNKIKHSVEVIRNYDEISPVLCYPDELNQVWTNLVHNALQAMDYKGTLTVDISQTDQYIIVGITDSGTGIPDEIRERIFEPFFTTKPPGEGSGMGLDIVKSIVDKHNGKIKVESVSGKTTFFVFIPRI